ncbi:histone-lysine n-methyltransferase ezh1 [Diplodia corticola]|uniref:Histone-lysine n-methyltransferase ezh1 n=1 Tax=Diplodia corticola TaxID=236234 RepID=A0A1J9QXN7_9PEZI|nr:histone-lysine n-methyltransferase ezh1 [Diplodia corticola]OJD33798.1 histone-lysine n-methyltransferase ezh1 [Diplodia corticola]
MAETEKLERVMHHLLQHRSPSKTQLDNFGKHMQWIKDVGSSHHLKPTAAKSRRKLRSLLGDVYHGVGIEPFMLCALSMPPFALYTLDRHVFLSRVREWWNQRSPHPLCLTQIADALCKTDSLEALLGPKPPHLALADAIASADNSTLPLHVPAPALPDLEPDRDPARQRHEYELTSLAQEMHRCLQTLSDDGLKETRWEEMLQFGMHQITNRTWAKEYHIPPDMADYHLPSADSADVLLATMDGLRQMVAGSRLLIKPVLVRGNPDELSYYESFQSEFIERLGDYSCGGGFLDVQDPTLPVWQPSARQMRFEDVADMLRAGSSGKLDNARPPLNLLNLRDFLELPLPQFLRASRFWLLRTLDHLVESATAPECSHMGKRAVARSSDLASCSRFLLYAARGAASGPHVDLLTGTWVQVLSGLKLWPIVTGLSDEERREFEKNGSDWVPPSEKTRVVLLEPGDLLVMPPGCPTPHAPITVRDCLMHGGMFWDEKSVVDTMESISWIVQNPNVTNEPIPRQLPEILLGLERMMRAKPERFVGEGAETSEELLQRFEAAVRSMRGNHLGCDCTGKCARNTCPCRNSGFPCFKYWCHRCNACSNSIAWETSS